MADQIKSETKRVMTMVKVTSDNKAINKIVSKGMSEINACSHSLRLLSND